jgi:glucose 1-dehydrogenase
MSVEATPWLEGQTAVVTGASSGIGSAVARALGAAGARVAVNFHSGQEEADEVVQDILRAGGQAIAVQADVSDEAQVRALFDACVQAFGRVDIVVANSGIQQDAPFTEMTLAQWQRVLDVNLTGQFLCTREAVRRFEAQALDPRLSRAKGKIICMSSVHEVIPWAGHVNYAASKGGMMLFMQSVAQELAPYRIRVNSVAPGAIQTPINRAAWETPDALARLLPLIPYGRIGQPADIGRAVAWLASDDADYVHGQTLFVDGGMTLYPEFARGG